MKFFVKLNVISMIFAFMLFVNSELNLNIYRIDRIIGAYLNDVFKIIGVLEIIGFVLCTILFYILIKSWLEGRKACFWSIFLWFPYYIFFIYIFAVLFPITNEADKPNPASGLIILGELIAYPIYLGILNFIGIIQSSTVEEVDN